MSKITICMDLIAGMLMALDLFYPQFGTRAGNWLLSKLPTQEEVRNPINSKTTRLSVIVTFYILIILIIWAIKSDPETYTTTQFWGTMVLYAIGAIAASILTTFLVKLLYGLGIYMKLIKPGEYVHAILWVLSTVIAFLALFIASKMVTSGSVLPMVPTATFVLAVLILPMVMISVNRIRGFLISHEEKPIYLIARIGLIIFVSSKGIDLFV